MRGYIVMAACTLLLLCGACVADTFYLSPDGDDLGPCSQTSPCASLSGAVAQADGVDQMDLLMFGGTYNGGDNIGVTLAIPTTIRPATSQSVTISGYGVNTPTLIDAAAEFAMFDIHLKGAVDCLVFNDASASLQLSGCSFEDCFHTGLVVTAGGDITLNDVYTDDTVKNAVEIQATGIVSIDGGEYPSPVLVEASEISAADLSSGHLQLTAAESVFIDGSSGSFIFVGVTALEVSIRDVTAKNLYVTGKVVSVHGATIVDLSVKSPEEGHGPVDFQLFDLVGEDNAWGISFHTSLGGSLLVDGLVYRGGKYDGIKVEQFDSASFSHLDLQGTGRFSVSNTLDGTHTFALRDSHIRECDVIFVPNMISTFERVELINPVGIGLYLIGLWTLNDVHATSPRQMFALYPSELVGSSTITRCTVQDMDSSSEFAVDIANDDVTISQCSFLNNGNALKVNSFTNLVIEDSLFENNSQVAVQLINTDEVRATMSNVSLVDNNNSPVVQCCNLDEYCPVSINLINISPAVGNQPADRDVYGCALTGDERPSYHVFEESTVGVSATLARTSIDKSPNSSHRSPQGHSPNVVLISVLTSVFGSLAMIAFVVVLVFAAVFVVRRRRRSHQAVPSDPELAMNNFPEYDTPSKV